MKENIHPKWYPEARVICACGNTWTTGATKPELRVDVCSVCHPFFTGEQRIVDTEGQVDRFYKRLQARDEYQADAAARETSRTSLEVSLVELGLDARRVNILTQNGLKTVGDVLGRLAQQGDEGLLGFPGFGRQALSEMKKKLRARGYQLPEDVPTTES